MPQFKFRLVKYFKRSDGMKHPVSLLLTNSWDHVDEFQSRWPGSMVEHLVAGHPIADI